MNEIKLKQYVLIAKAGCGGVRGKRDKFYWRLPSDGSAYGARFFLNSYPKTQKFNPCEHHYVRKKFSCPEKKRSRYEIPHLSSCPSSHTNHPYILRRPRDIDPINTIFSSKMTNLSMNEIKLKQYVLIAKAGCGGVRGKRDKFYWRLPSDAGQWGRQSFYLAASIRRIRSKCLPQNEELQHSFKRRNLQTRIRHLF